MQANLEATLATLVSMPSISNDPRSCQTIINFVHEELKSYGLFIQTSQDAPNPWLIATTKNTKTPDILLAAHLDVIPAGNELFRMQKRGGKLYGRGVYDMKFAVACYLEFLSTHASMLSTLNIGLLFTTDEEKDSGSMPKVMATGLRPKVVFLPDGGDNWTIEKRAKGSYGIELIATGKTAHGSRPWEGTSALHTLLDAIEPLRVKYAFRSKHEPTLMVNGIHSGQALNQIPDYAAAELDFRCFNQHEFHEYLATITDIVNRYNNLTMHMRREGNAIEFDETSPFVQGFLQSLRDQRGVPPTFGDSYGASDARFFTALNIPCIIIQPQGGGRHSNDEWLKADDLAAYYRLLEHWIINEATTSPVAPQHEGTSLSAVKAEPALT